MRKELQYVTVKECKEGSLRLVWVRMKADDERWVSVYAPGSETSEDERKAY